MAAVPASRSSEFTRRCTRAGDLHANRSRSSTLMVGPIAEALDQEAAPRGEVGRVLDLAFKRFADDLA